MKLCVVRLRDDAIMEQVRRPEKGLSAETAELEHGKTTVLTG